MSSLNSKIERNLNEIEKISKKAPNLELLDVFKLILIELETNRLIHEQNYNETTSLITNNTEYLKKIVKKLEKSQKKTLWSKIKSIFNGKKTTL